eukprot:TRINITY_DN10318_c0_g2_i1.p1 TRINITY_DN10318_c0_g2~~TRINITY_DN10318_c0_g2_i1.p1  ORF type:complete len:330 (-),score=18.63 TRINITY_DN10318_c0_g2_i1:93-1082(-)
MWVSSFVAILLLVPVLCEHKCTWDRVPPSVPEYFHVNATVSLYLRHGEQPVISQRQHLRLVRAPRFMTIVSDENSLHFTGTHCRLVQPHGTCHDLVSCPNKIPSIFPSLQYAEFLGKQAIEQVTNRRPEWLQHYLMETEQRDTSLDPHFKVWRLPAAHDSVFLLMQQHPRKIIFTENALHVLDTRPPPSSSNSSASDVSAWLEIDFSEWSVDSATLNPILDVDFSHKCLEYSAPEAPPIILEDDETTIHFSQTRHSSSDQHQDHDMHSSVSSHTVRLSYYFYHELGWFPFFDMVVDESGEQRVNYDETDDTVKAALSSWVPSWLAEWIF